MGVSSRFLHYRVAVEAHRLTLTQGLFARRLAMFKSTRSRRAVYSSMASVLLYALIPTTGIVGQAHAWYGCEAGYTLEIRGGSNNPSGARCLRPAVNVRKSPDAGCPVGTTFNRDHSGNTDYCLPVTGSLLKRFASKCGPGQSVDRRRGTDRCYKHNPPQQKAVTRNVN